MTRINVGVSPKELMNKHLLAEHREIKRIPNLIQKGRFRLENVPREFTLGKGHVAFFYNKLEFLKERYQEIHEECLRRGFNVQDYSESWKGIPSALMGKYIPTEKDRQIILQRIEEKLSKKPKKS